MDKDGLNQQRIQFKMPKKTDRKSYQFVERQRRKVRSIGFCEYHKDLIDALGQTDPQIYELVSKEYDRQQNTIQLVAAENECSRAVLAALGSVVQNKTAEGFPDSRHHGGCDVIDEIERLAVNRVKKLFKAQYANVQPHSGSQANQIVLTALLQKGDNILSFDIDQGGHPSHGAAESFAGKFFNVYNYYVEPGTFILDYEKIRRKALEVRPKLIMCGASAYPRKIDFEKFRKISDEVNAYLLADISHVAGLAIAGAHLSPIDYAHFTTTSTYKAGGPRGGLILMGKDFEQKLTWPDGDVSLWQLVEKATHPGVQGTPYFNHITAKAVFFYEADSVEYKTRQFKVVENAKALADSFVEMKYDVLTGGTDNHMMLVDVSHSRKGLNGRIAQKCLQDCGIVVDWYKLPFEPDKSGQPTGIRLGTPVVTRRKMGIVQMQQLASMIDAILQKVDIIDENSYELNESLKNKISSQVKDLCSKFRMF